MTARFAAAALGGNTGGTAFIINEGAEGTGTPSGWVNFVGTPDWDYTSVPLAGSQSLYLPTNGNNVNCRYDWGGAIPEAWVYFLFRITNGTAPSVNTTQLCGFAATGGGANLNGMSFSTALKLRVGTSVTTTALALDTTYHVWFHYLKGTGADAVMDGAFSTDGVRPTSGNQFVQITGANGTNDVGKVFIGTNAASLNLDTIYDNIRVAATQIGDNGT